MHSETKLTALISSLTAESSDREEIILQLKTLSSLLALLEHVKAPLDRYPVIRNSGLASILKILVYENAENDSVLTEIQLYTEFLLAKLNVENSTTEVVNRDESILYALESALQYRITEIRMSRLLHPVHEMKSLTPNSGAEKVWRADSSDLCVLYSNKVDRIQLDFEVSLLPFKTEILDPRIVKIPEGKNNEKHKHAHETLFIFVEGSGVVIIDDLEIMVHPGDIVFIPRWSIHQTCNTGQGQLCFLAVADYGFTGKAYMGNYVKTTRMRPEREFTR